MNKRDTTGKRTAPDQIKVDVRVKTRFMRRVVTVECRLSTDVSMSVCDYIVY